MKKMEHFEKLNSRNNLVMIKCSGAGILMVHVLGFFSGQSYTPDGGLRLYFMYENQGVSESREKSQFSLQSIVGIPSISVLLEKEIQ